MLRNADISGVMNAIIGNLLPVCAKGANPQLWLIYNEMQEWEMLVERKVPLFNANEPVQIAKAIRRQIDGLANRQLAHAIEQVLMRHTPHAFAAVH